MIVAIDGPAGSGKSTVSKRVARTLGLLYVDTGAMYRALTLKAVNEKIDLTDEKALQYLAVRTSIILVPDGDRTSVFLDTSEVTDAIRLPTITEKVRFIARVPGVREQMVRLQREVARGAARGAVLEGRDIGTVVFPDADRKFFLEASIGERARRRHKELQAAGIFVDSGQLERDIAARDESDRNRSAGPLKKADDAIAVDTTKLSIDEVVEFLLKQIGG